MINRPGDPNPGPDDWSTFFQAIGRWSKNEFDGLTMVEAKVDAISVIAVRLASTRYGAQSKERTRFIMPLGLSFSLHPGCLSYLGRLHVDIHEVGKSAASPLPIDPTVISATEQSVEYNIWIEQNDASMRRDIERAYSMHPSLRKELACIEVSRRQAPTTLRDVP
jgi:hypothetical protein